VTFAPSTGAFSLTIPATQPTGTCQLSFTVTFNDGTAPETDVFTITVSSSTAGLAAPTLTGVTVARGTPPAGDTATFTFNQTLSSQLPAASAFRLYRASGAYAVGTGAPTHSGASWTVSFPAGSADNAALGAVRAGAVTNAAGDMSFPGSVPVTGSSAASLLTNEPDLTGVGAATAVGTTAFTLVFTFDKAVQTAPNAGSTFCVIPTAGTPSPVPVFEAIEANGTTIPESSATPPFSVALTGGQTTCAPSTTVTATFPGNTATLSLLSGAVQHQRVEGSAADTVGNPVGSRSIAGSSAAATFPVLQRAVESYAKGTTTTNVTLVFSGPPGTPTASSAGDFVLIEGSGQQVAATATPTAGTDPSTLVATFPSSAVASAVGLAVTAGGLPNVPDTAVPLTGQGGVVGQVVLPQLTGVTVTPASGVAGPTVTFTFDKAYTAASAPGADFLVYNAHGLQLAAAAGTGAISGSTVTFACPLVVSCTTGFSTAQLSGMAAAGVQDSTASDNPPVAPEGAVI
jgi:hypothetical protein